MGCIRAKLQAQHVIQPTPRRLPAPLTEAIAKIRWMKVRTLRTAASGDVSLWCRLMFNAFTWWMPEHSRIGCPHFLDEPNTARLEHWLLLCPYAIKCLRTLRARWESYIGTLSDLELVAAIINLEPPPLTQWWNLLTNRSVEDRIRQLRPTLVLLWQLDAFALLRHLWSARSQTQPHPQQLTRQYDNNITQIFYLTTNPIAHSIARTVHDSEAPTPDDNAVQTTRVGSPKRLVIAFDSACRGNCGATGMGFTITTAQPAYCLIRAGYAYTQTVGTNNVAEYQALALALKAGLPYTPAHVHIRGDSKLLITQLQRAAWPKTSTLRAPYQQIIHLLRHYSSATFEHRRRQHNKAADTLANLALDHRIGSLLDSSHTPATIRALAFVDDQNPSLRQG